MNLYRTLKVKKSATKEEIASAFRKRSLETHPDRGGNREQFEAVKLAYSILGDDAKRKHYDETGEFSDKPDNGMGPVLALVAGHFAAVMQHLIGTNCSPANEDMVGHLRKSISAKQRELQQQKMQTQKVRDYYRDCLGRFTSSGGDHLLDDIVKQQMAPVEACLVEIAKAMELHARGLQLLADYAYRCDPKQANVGMFTMGQLMGMLSEPSSNGHVRFTATFGPDGSVKAKAPTP